MNFIDFKRQSLSVQAHLLCRQGTYLSERTAGDYFVALYALFDYYVEVHYHLESSEVVMITSFYHTNLLEPYLAKISLEKLLRSVLVNEALQTG